MNISKPWKKIGRIFQSLENFRPFFPRFGKKGTASTRGSALIVALWLLIILSIMIGSFAFDMNIEAGITGFYRKRLKAQYLARAGVEYAKLLLAKSSKVNATLMEEGEDETAYIRALNLQRGMGVSGISFDVGEGKFLLDLLPEQGRRDINKMIEWARGGDRDDLKEIFDEANIPQDKWDELIDCLIDWTDPGDEQQLNGAESDDSFYEQRGYKCKNAPLDTVDELLLIKGFTPSIVYGGPSDDPKGEPLKGIAQWLTTWGDSGLVNVNTASAEVLLTIPGLYEEDVQEIINNRGGEDKELGTKDDGYKSVDEVITLLGLTGKEADDIRKRITTNERRYVRVVSKGEVMDTRSGIWSIFRVDGQGVFPVYWREEDMP